MRVLVSGYYGFRNAGDEAILAGLVQALKECQPDVHITVVSAKAALTRAWHGVEAVSRNRPRAIWGAVRGADLVLSGGGSLLQDVTGVKSIPYYLGIVGMGLLLRKPAMLCAQGIGPVRRPVSRLLVRAVANRVAAVTVRDPESAAELARLGVGRPPVTVTADAALVLAPGDPERGRRLWARAGVADGSRPLLGVSIRPWRTPAHFLPALAEALAALATETGARVGLVPLQWPHDVAPMRELAALVAGRSPEAGPVVLDEGYHYAQVMDLVAACNLVLGMRYHALVFGAMAGVPVLGVTYDPKNDNFLRQVGLAPAGSTERLDPGALVQAGLALWGAQPRWAAHLLAATAGLARQARENARLALELVNRGK